MTDRLRIKGKSSEARNKAAAEIHSRKETLRLIKHRRKRRRSWVSTPSQIAHEIFPQSQKPKARGRGKMGKTGVSAARRPGLSGVWTQREKGTPAEPRSATWPSGVAAGGPSPNEMAWKPAGAHVRLKSPFEWAPSIPQMPAQGTVTPLQVSKNLE